MSLILFVFAIGLDQIGIGQQLHGHLGTPRLGVGLGIVDDDLDFEVPEIRPRETLGKRALPRSADGP